MHEGASQKRWVQAMGTGTHPGTDVCRCKSGQKGATPHDERAPFVGVPERHELLDKSGERPRDVGPARPHPLRDARHMGLERGEDRLVRKNNAAQQRDVGDGVRLLHLRNDLPRTECHCLQVLTCLTLHCARLESSFCVTVTIEPSNEHTDCRREHGRNPSGHTAIANPCTRASNDSEQRSACAPQHRVRPGAATSTSTESHPGQRPAQTAQSLPVPTSVVMCGDGWGCMEHRTQACTLTVEQIAQSSGHRQSCQRSTTATKIEARQTVGQQQAQTRQRTANTV
jgi:hypothetical protein